MAFEAGHNGTEIGLDNWVHRGYFQGVLQTFGGLFQRALLVQQYTQIAVSVGQIRRDADRPPVAICGGFKLAFLLENHAQIGVGFGHVGSADRDRPCGAPVHDFQGLELGVDARQVDLHPRLVEHASAFRARRLGRPFPDGIEQSIREAGYREGDSFVVQL